MSIPFICDIQKRHLDDTLLPSFGSRPSGSSVSGFLPLHPTAPFPPPKCEGRPDRTEGRHWAAATGRGLLGTELWCEMV